MNPKDMDTYDSLFITTILFDSFEPNAESQCETYLAQAIQIEPVTPEVYQTMASVRLSQQRVDEAKAALAQGLALWLGSDPTEEDGPTPDYETRLALVKLLLETAMYDEAFTVLNGLIEENDQVPDTLYLFGWANYIAAEEVDESSPTADEERQEQLENAREALNACVKVLCEQLLDNLFCCWFLQLLSIFCHAY